MAVEEVEAELSSSSFNKFCNERKRTEDGKRLLMGSKKYLYFFLYRGG